MEKTDRNIIGDPEGDSKMKKGKIEDLATLPLKSIQDINLYVQKI